MHAAKSDLGVFFHNTPSSGSFVILKHSPKAGRAERLAGLSDCLTNAVSIHFELNAIYVCFYARNESFTFYSLVFPGYMIVPLILRVSPTYGCRSSQNQTKASALKRVQFGPLAQQNTFPIKKGNDKIITRDIDAPFRPRWSIQIGVNMWVMNPDRERIGA